MSHTALFVSRPDLPPEDLDLLAKHIAMDLVELPELCEGLAITIADVERLSLDREFQARIQRERRRLLTAEGRRDLLDWKQALTEGQYWDRLMTLGLNEQAAAGALIDAMKVVKRPQERGGSNVGGGAGGPQFAVTINLGAATTTVVGPTPRVIEGGPA